MSPFYATLIHRVSHSLYPDFIRGSCAVLALSLLVACAGTAPPALAQSQDNIRVIVMGEDEDPNSVSRRSDIYTRVIAELQESMFRSGFQLVDEDMLAADLGWRVRERLSKVELIEQVNLANGEGRGNLYSRALFLFRIHATKEDLSYATRIRVRISGELYDIESNSFLGTFELPRVVASAPADCSTVCLNETVGDKAREIAAGLGDVMARKLAYLTPADGYGSDLAFNDAALDSRCENLPITYTMEFKRFSPLEIDSVMRILTNDLSDLSPNEALPCYRDHELLVGGNSAIRRYSYRSHAARHRLFGWLELILRDSGMGYDEGRVTLYTDGSAFIMDKVIGGREIPAADQSGQKFN